MKATVLYSDKEFEEMRKKFNKLKELTKGITPFENEGKKYGLTKYSFYGTITEELVESLGRMPTEDEIILLVDGYSHFGARCKIIGMEFNGYVYTD